MSILRTPVTVALAFAVLAACERNPADTFQPEPGSMSFAYSGATLNGTFTTFGLPTWDRQADDLALSDFAYGMREGGESLYAGLRARTAPRADVAILFTEGVGIGTYSVHPNCVTNCGFGLFAIDVDYFDAEMGEGAFIFLDEGEVRVTQLQNGRARGTFSGVGTELDTGEEVTITDGVFVVTMFTEAQLRARQSRWADDAGQALTERFDTSRMTAVQKVRLARALAELEAVAAR